jgi:phosphomannomutase
LLSTRAALNVDKEEKAIYLELQNGSDVRGIALATESSKSRVTLTPARVAEIAGAFARWLKRMHSEANATAGEHSGAIRIAVGRDPRLSGAELRNAVAIALQSEGCEMFDVGIATTPAMFMSTVLSGFEYDGALMLTASHLPPDRNGMKFFTKEGGTDKKQIRMLLEDAYEHSTSREAYRLDSRETHLLNVKHADLMPAYASYLRHRIQNSVRSSSNPTEPLGGAHIIVDAGNGAAGFFATDVLAPLGANTSGSQFLVPDGTFPNHVPNPEDKKAMQMASEAVLKSHADLGIVFDTDGDRCGFVDKDGTAINRNRLIALLAAIVLREHPGATILTDSVTSNGLAEFIKKHGGRHFRYRKGYKNIIDKAIELNRAGIDCPLAIETSGHGAMRENYMLDDGAYLAVKIVSELVNLRNQGDHRGVTGLLEGLSEPLEEKEFRLNLLTEDYKETGKMIVDAFHDFVVGADAPKGWLLENENYEGWRVAVQEGDGMAGWLLLRQSLHDPLLPLNVESETRGGVARISRIFYDWAKSRFAKVLDLSPLETVLA